MSVLGNPLLLGPEGYQISRSVRLRSSASAYFNRTPASAGNRQIYTWSGWVKRGTLGGTFPSLFWANNGSTSDVFQFNNADALRFFQNDGISSFIATAAVFRDPSAWYHIVLAVDTTQATASNRVKIYVNGVSQNLSVSTYPTQNYSGYINNTFVHRIGNSDSFDGYLTEVNFIDGQALTPASFGETDSITGVWKPKKYAGTYGTNGFYLNFSDNSSNTATTIGKDYSGNGNNWTPNNISVTSGVTYDSMLDVPTMWADGGNGRGNYAVVNPLSKGTSQTSVIDGNLYAIPISGASNWGTVFSSIAIPTSGKWYMEATAQVYAGSGNSSSFGVVDATSFIPTNSAILYTFSTGEGFDGILAHLFSDYVSPISDGVQGTNVTGLTGTSINLMLALDVDNGKVYAGYNGTWLNSGNPAGNTGEIATRTFSANDVVAGHTSWNGTNDQSQYYNFGQRPFAYTPPAGFKALHTGNLPEPTIKLPNKWFDATTWTGDNTTNRTIANAGSFQPDLVWTKGRSTTWENFLQDAVRGAPNFLISNSTNAEATTSPNIVSSFAANGFVVQNNGNSNASGSTYVAWQWKEGATAGFDIVTYTGTGANRTVAHSLGVAPKMMIVKSRSAAGQNWLVYHSALGATKALFLDLTNASTTATTPWNDTAPSSTVFTVGTSSGSNANGTTYVAYLFAEVAGFSRFGSYTGNGSADGPFVFCGFRPRFVMVKRTDSTANWITLDAARNPGNEANGKLYPNLSNAEDLGAAAAEDFLSNGFKLRATWQDMNQNGATYIFMAFAENPFKNSLAR